MRVYLSASLQKSRFSIIYLHDLATMVVLYVHVPADTR